MQLGLNESLKFSIIKQAAFFAAVFCGICFSDCVLFEITQKRLSG